MIFYIISKKPGKTYFLIYLLNHYTANFNLIYVINHINILNYISTKSVIKIIKFMNSLISKIAILVDNSHPIRKPGNKATF